MATFQAQVESLTSLSVSDTAELTQFLNDGVIDVTNKWLTVKPQDGSLFTRVTSELTDNGHDIGAAKVLSVVRENGVVNNWEICTEVPASMQYKVTDTESLSFASKYNPVFIRWNDGGITTYPAPGASPNRYKIFYVNNVPTFSGGASTVASDNIHYFPIDKIYLVVMYAGIKLLQATMGDNVIAVTSVPPDVPTLSTVSFSETNSLSITATDPTAISLTTVDYSAASATASTVLSSLTAPTYAKPYLDDIADSTAISGGSDNTTKLHRFREEFTSIGDLSITAVPPDVPTLTSISYSGPGATDASLTIVATGGTLGSSVQPTYTTPAQATNSFADVNTALDNEDMELAVARINEAQLIIQDELNEFNEENIKYQASVQESMAEFQSQNEMNLQNASNSNNRLLQNAIQDAKVILDNNAQAIQKYQTEISEYQAEIGMEVQEYQANWSKQLQEWSGYQSTVLQHYQIEIQNELNDFNKENTAFQYEVQKALADANATNQIAMQNGIQEARDAIENNNAAVSRFQAMASHYATQVNEDVQAYTSQLQGDVQQMQADLAANQNLLSKYQAEIAEYQAEVTAETQEQSTKMQQYQLLYSQLKAEYDQVFMIAAPKPQPQQARR